MSIQDVIAIASFAIAMLGIVYAFGQRDSRLEALEKDVNSLGKKVEFHREQVYIELKSFDKRADKQSVFMVKIDQRVRQIQEAFVGEQRTDRLREIPKPDPPYKSDDDQWYCENSGIDL